MKSSELSLNVVNSRSILFLSHCLFQTFELPLEILPISVISGQARAHPSIMGVSVSSFLVFASLQKIMCYLLVHNRLLVK